MIAKLFKSRPPRSTPSIPEGRRVYAIGDVHGCADLLDRLLAMIEADDAARGLAETTIILLGDVVDRGPDSRGVLDRLVRLVADRSDVRFLLGNHEEIFLGALDGEPKALRLFCKIGGRETVLSYGIEAAAYDSMDYDHLTRALQGVVPAEHRRLLDRFEDMVVIGDYAFVHAGVRPDVPIEAQTGADLRWIRNAFLDHRGRLEKTIVHGHTISDDVDRTLHRIGIDTGAYTSGRLTALGLEGAESWNIQT